MKIGEKIRSVIKEKGLVQKLVAEKIGTSERNLQKIFEKDSLNTDQLQKISEVLNHNFFQYYNIDDWVIDDQLKFGKEAAAAPDDVEIEFKITIKNPHKRAQLIRQILSDDQIKLLMDGEG